MKRVCDTFKRIPVAGRSGCEGNFVKSETFWDILDHISEGNSSLVCCDCFPASIRGEKQQLHYLFFPTEQQASIFGSEVDENRHHLLKDVGGSGGRFHVVSGI